MTESRENDSKIMENHANKTCYGRWMSEEYEPGLVSVVIPTYNRAHTIGDTLASVFAQTYRPLEIIVVDDGSEDNTKELIGRWADKCGNSDDLCLRFLQQENRYAPAARNYGLLESHGEFIQFLDSDDLMAPSKIERQVKHLSQGDPNTAVYGPWHWFIVEPNAIKIVKHNFERYEETALQNWIAGRWFVPSHCLLYRRIQVRRIGPWDESLRANQDGDHSMRFLLRGGRLSYCPSAWSYYRLYDESSDNTASSNRRISFISRYRIISRIEEQITIKGQLDEYREALSMRYALLAKRCALHYRDIANRCLKDSKRLSPNGRLPDIFTFPLLSRILGLTYKQRLGRFIRNMFSIPYCDPSSNWDFEPIVTVRTLEEVFRIENPEVCSDDA